MEINAKDRVATTEPLMLDVAYRGRSTVPEQGKLPAGSVGLVRCVKDGHASVAFEWFMDNEFWRGADIVRVGIQNASGEWIPIRPAPLVVLGTLEQRKRWFANLVELAPWESLVAEGGEEPNVRDKAVGVLLQQSDPGSGATTVDDVDRYALFSSGDFSHNHDLCIGTCDRAHLEASIADSALEGEGWALTDVYDLETGEKVEYEMTVKLKEA